MSYYEKASRIASRAGDSSARDYADRLYYGAKGKAHEMGYKYSKAAEEDKHTY